MHVESLSQLALSHSLRNVHEVTIEYFDYLLNGAASGSEHTPPKVGCCEGH